MAVEVRQGRSMWGLLASGGGGRKVADVAVAWRQGRSVEVEQGGG